MRSARIEEILLVEDDPIDVRLFKRAADKVGLDVPIVTAENAEKALSYLRAQAADAASSSRIVVTDINMPGLTGHELMEDVRKETSLTSTVFFVYSSSENESDVAKAYGNGAAGYVVKGDTESSILSFTSLLKHFSESVTILRDS